MRLLIDTHAFLWAASDKDRLSERARSLIEDASNEIYVSSASLWEIAIKIGIGKLRLTSPYETFIAKQLAITNILVLSSSIRHYAALAALPVHHKDPFDRLIIAQSIVEATPIVSIDAKFDTYLVNRIW
jgi:PIN domain nuclease of toxin-antitoxin system